jgi:hypothetical protein
MARDARRKPCLLGSPTRLVKGGRAGEACTRWGCPSPYGGIPCPAIAASRPPPIFYQHEAGGARESPPAAQERLLPGLRDLVQLLQELASTLPTPRPVPGGATAAWTVSAATRSSGSLLDRFPRVAEPVLSHVATYSAWPRAGASDSPTRDPECDRPGHSKISNIL